MTTQILVTRKEIEGKTYTKVEVSTAKADFEIMLSRHGYIDVLRTRNGKAASLQVMPKTFWSWKEVAANYKGLAPHVIEIQKQLLEDAFAA